MKILLVTAWYFPFIHPRAHRWTAIAEHWAKEGHTVQVLTAQVKECTHFQNLNGVQVHRVGFDSLKEWFFYRFGTRMARGRVGGLPKKPGLLGRVAAWGYQVIWKNLFFPDDACIWYFPARRKLKQLLEQENFEVIITVSLPFTGHLLGLFAHRYKFKHPAKPFWIADIGDPFSFQAKPPNNPLLFDRINRRLERRVLETADAITVTTPATLLKYRQQFGERSVANISVLPPLLTNPLLAGSPLHVFPSKSIKIGYFGALYAPTRTPDAFLDLLAQTFSKRPDLRTRLEIHFYGEVFPEFYAKLSAEPGIHLHGLQGRADAWLAMQSMDILLNIGNTTDFQLPSKAVDYLASGKPVLHLSYVDQDPFVSFFKDFPALFVLKMDHRGLWEGDIDRWLHWLESEKPCLTQEEIAARVAPYQLSRIAGQYLALISPRSPE